MENDSEVLNDPNIDTEVEADETDSEETLKQDKQERPAETPEARKARLERQLEQHRKKHPELYEEKTEKQAKPKSDELDYGQKAYLAANNIKDKDEVKLVQTIMKETGRNLEQVLESKYFNAELEEMREKAKSQKASDATSKSKRSSNSAKDEVDYWIAKGELPEDRALRVKVIEARRSKDSKANPFKK